MGGAEALRRPRQPGLRPANTTSWRRSNSATTSYDRLCSGHSGLGRPGSGREGSCRSSATCWWHPADSATACCGTVPTPRGPATRGAMVTPGVTATRGAMVTPGVTATRGATVTPGVTAYTGADSGAGPRPFPGSNEAAPGTRSDASFMRVAVAHSGAGQQRRLSKERSGQTRTTITPVPAVRPLYFEHLTVRDGLSQSTVMSFLQDSQGYLWLATESGLDRYDGYSIQGVSAAARQRAGLLASDYSGTIAEDASQQPVAGHGGGGIERWDRRTIASNVTRHDPHNPRRWPAMRAHAAHRSGWGLVWAGTSTRATRPPRPCTRWFVEAATSGTATVIPTRFRRMACAPFISDPTGRIWVGPMAA